MTIAGKPISLVKDDGSIHRTDHDTIDNNLDPLPVV